MSVAQWPVAATFIDTTLNHPTLKPQGALNL